MKKTFSFLLILSMTLAGFLITAAAQSIKETIYEFRTVDDPMVPYDRDVVQRAPFWDPSWDVENPPPYVVLLGASIWSMHTKKCDATVINDMVLQIGTGTAVAVITDPTFTPFAFDSPIPFYFEATINKHNKRNKRKHRDITITANGYCIITDKNVPEAGIIQVSCDLAVQPDPEEGIIGGSAVSNSIFNPYNLQGYQTGSFWTVRLYQE